MGWQPDANVVGYGSFGAEGTGAMTPFRWVVGRDRRVKGGRKIPILFYRQTLPGPFDPATAPVRLGLFLTSRRKIEVAPIPDTMPVAAAMRVARGLDAKVLFQRTV
jgi:hypothetical protein